MEQNLKEYLEGRTWHKHYIPLVESQWHSTILPHFEQLVKPDFDIREGLEGSEGVTVLGLKADPHRNLQKNQLQIPRSICDWIFPLFSQEIRLTGVFV